MAPISKITSHTTWLALALAIISVSHLASPSMAENLPIPTKRPDTPASASSNNEAQPLTPTPSPEAEKAFEQCARALAKDGVVFETLPSISPDDGCGLNFPVSVKSFSGGTNMTPESKLSCETAKAANNWIKQSVIPAAKIAFPNDTLTQITHASTYVCRNRNNQPNVKLSEHAKGNALDIASFQFASGKIITIEPRQRTGSMEESFQKAVRFSACLHFTTVLGPFSDEFHKDHLHLDIASRNRDYRLCDYPDLPADPVNAD